MFYGAKLKAGSRERQGAHVRDSTIMRAASCAPSSQPASSTIPTQKSVVDVLGGLEMAQHIEENSIVLLKNEDNILPLDACEDAFASRSSAATPIPA